MQELNGIQIVYIFSLGMVAEGIVVAGEAQEILDSQSIKIRLAAKEQNLTTAVWLSVTLTASAQSFKYAALWRKCSASAPRGGPHSQVMPFWPLVKIFSRLLSAVMVVISSTPPGS
jgi:hypothetical protein